MRGQMERQYSLEKFKLYETQSWYYLVGRDREKRYWRVLKIDRTEPKELNIIEDPVVYTKLECVRSLQRVADGNKPTGGLNFVTKAYGIVGFIRFLESYYMILVSKRRQIGTMCGHAVYAIDESQILTVPHPSVQTEVAASKSELRYKKLLASVDLTKDFYFTYTYNLMHTLQRNALEASINNNIIPYDNMFVWNAFLTLGIRSRLGNTQWTVALIHGYFQQALLSVYGRIFSLTLIARRSRHFAGTRYLKRGVNDKGRVANDVETEQIVLDEYYGRKPGQMSSVVQNRGSIPLFWSQEASRLSPKPDIVLQRYDPVYLATKLHFEDLSRRYGNPIVILNLIKTVEKRPREMILRREFATAVGYLNQILPEEKRLKFIHWDFHKFAKSKSANVLAVLGAVATQALDLTGFYYSGKPGKPKQLLHSSLQREAKSQETERGRTFQSGVLRTNCIDCLDRTNIAQYAYGLAALGRQLHSIGVTDVAKVDPDSSVAAALMDMYRNMGDALALQYGGSAAHNTVFLERQGKWKATTQSKEFINSIKRYYSNTYTDGEKQDAMNLFLGHFRPQEGKPALWDLDSDYYLHIAGCGEDPEEEKSLVGNPKPQANSSTAATVLFPLPGSEGLDRLKLISLAKAVGSVRMVSTQSDSNSKNGKASCTAPDAAEVQLKSPIWLFGQRKSEETHVQRSDEVEERREEMGTKDDLLLGILPHDNDDERDLLLSPTVERGDWYGNDVFFGMVDKSPANQHYAELCEVGKIRVFDHTSEEISCSYNDPLDESSVTLEMDSALQEYELLGNAL